MQLQPVDKRGLWLEQVRVVATGSDGVDVSWFTSVFNVARFVGKRLTMAELLLVQACLHRCHAANLQGLFTWHELEDLRERAVS